MSSAAVENRAELLTRLFPEGIPKLWCPALTHYDREARIDVRRIEAHLRHISTNVRGFLILGSTGDGWELSELEVQQLLNLALEQAQKLKIHLLMGALKADADSALGMIRGTVNLIQSRTSEGEIAKSLAKARVCGFAVCPPTGKDKSEAEIEIALEKVLNAGVPIALYQLPQVTQNEISPGVTSRLASRFANFFMFKDTSGTDRVIKSGNDLAGVFMVRGAERDYATWLKAAGGNYDGFLLSTANCFAKELRQMITDLSEARADAANELSKRLTATISAAFELAAPFPHGNAYANANKAMDHFFAYGPKAASVPPPRLHAGSSLPSEMIVQTGKILERYGLMPTKGYLV
jgi:dihydrodipicolinate synthase/N-acetylneuraminate lyase